ncbi:hypothetical protein ACNKHN_07975 [Shigella flexneri]
MQVTNLHRGYRQYFRFYSRRRRARRLLLAQGRHEVVFHATTGCVFIRR